MSYIDIFLSQTQLITQLGRDKTYTAWVMANYIEKQDVLSLAAEALTDGPDDKKIDFIHFDRDEKTLVFTQGYYATAIKEAAPSSKASDLNTAAAWLFSGDVSTIPSTIKEIIMVQNSQMKLSYPD